MAKLLNCLLFTATADFLLLPFMVIENGKIKVHL
jgi:hypothetical protein